MGFRDKKLSACDVRMCACPFKYKNECGSARFVAHDIASDLLVALNENLQSHDAHSPSPTPTLTLQVTVIVRSNPAELEEEVAAIRERMRRYNKQWRIFPDGGEYAF